MQGMRPRACTLRPPPRAISLLLAVALLGACGEGPSTPQDHGDALDAQSDACAPDCSSDVRIADADADATDAALIVDTAPPRDAPDVLSDVADADAGVAPWRSALYPAAWTPAFTDGDGRFVHDFSYAGYRHGEAEPGQDLPVETFDVVAGFGADPSGASDSTAAIQAAIDGAQAAGGGIVLLPAGLFRLDGSLIVSASRVVLRGEGAAQSRLFFSKFEGMGYGSHITVRGNLSTDLDLPLVDDGLARSNVLAVADAGALAVGDDVEVGWVVTDAFVEEHAMTGTWQAHNGAYAPFFQRTVVAIDRSATAHRVTLDVPLRYAAKLRDDASLRRVTGYLSECGVERLGVSNGVGWDQAWSQTQVHALELRGVKDCWVREIASFVSPLAPTSGPGAGAHLQSGGLLVRDAKRVTVADSTLERAENRGSGGCGYLFHVRRSNEVLFRDLVGRDGRHNFIQNWEFGTSGVAWLRVLSEGGRTYSSSTTTLFAVGASEFHHSLAMANLIDSVTVHDGWSAINRHGESSGAGHTSTEATFWNVGGTGILRSYQFGRGYVIGTAAAIDARTQPTAAPPGFETVWAEIAPWIGSEPLDWTEGLGTGAELEPSSLYEDQLARRLAR